MNTFANGWYAILAQKELRRIEKPFAFCRFGVDLVLWRTSENEVVALHDRCPHRSAKLSLGKIKQGTITCPFHGFQFNAQGQCTLAPEFAKAIPGLCVQKYATQQAFGMIWLYWGAEPSPFNFPLLQQIDTEFQGVYSQTQRVWRTHITRAIENQLDYTHLPFVHKNTIGRHYELPQHPRIETTATSIAVYLRETATQPSFTFLLPNVWNLHVSDQLQLIVYFVPIDANTTQFYLRTYRKFLTFPFWRKLFNPLFNAMNLIILNQDRRVVESQGNAPSYEAAKELLMRHDAAIKHFREMWVSQISL